MSVDILQRLRARLAETTDPLLSEMLQDRIAELSAPVSEIAPSPSVVRPPEPEAAPLPTRPAYKTVRDELERIYCELRDALGPGKKFSDRWPVMVRNTLKRQGWTEEEFYAEMDRLGRQARWS